MTILRRHKKIWNRNTKWFDNCEATFLNYGRIIFRAFAAMAQMVIFVFSTNLVSKKIVRFDRNLKLLLEIWSHFVEMLKSWIQLVKQTSRTWITRQSVTYPIFPYRWRLKIRPHFVTGGFLTYRPFNTVSKLFQLRITVMA